MTIEVSHDEENLVTKLVVDQLEKVVEGSRMSDEDSSIFPMTLEHLRHQLSVETGLSEN